MVNDYLVGGWALPLRKMMEWVTVGMMSFPTEWKNEIHVPNHQPEIDELGVSSGYAPRSKLWKWIFVFYKLDDFGLERLDATIITNENW